MKEITVIMPTCDGVLADIAACLGKGGINIETLEAFNVRDWDILRLTASDCQEALRLLHEDGYEAVSEDLVIINIKDQPGALASIARRLSNGGIKMRSVRSLHRQGGEAMIAVAMDRMSEGMRLIDDLLVAKMAD